MAYGIMYSTLSIINLIYPLCCCDRLSTGLVVYSSDGGAIIYPPEIQHQRTCSAGHLQLRVLLLPVAKSGGQAITGRSTCGPVLLEKETQAGAFCGCKRSRHC